MPSQSFPRSESRAKRPFELVHMDLKALPVISYHKYKYFITFLDDYMSFGWLAMLKSKSDSNNAIRHFVVMAKNQYQSNILYWCLYDGLRG